jgi:hypothetical protein
MAVEPLSQDVAKLQFLTARLPATIDHLAAAWREHDLPTLAHADVRALVCAFPCTFTRPLMVRRFQQEQQRQTRQECYQ